MSVDAFAMARGATGRVDANQTAERIWEPKFVAEFLDRTSMARGTGSSMISVAMI